MFEFYIIIASLMSDNIYFTNEIHFHKAFCVISLPEKYLHIGTNGGHYIVKKEKLPAKG